MFHKIPIQTVRLYAVSLLINLVIGWLVSCWKMERTVKKFKLSSLPELVPFLEAYLSTGCNYSSVSSPLSSKSSANKASRLQSGCLYSAVTDNWAALWGRRQWHSNYFQPERNAGNAAGQQLSVSTKKFWVDIISPSSTCDSNSALLLTN